MTSRDQVLDAMQTLVLESGSSPSLQRVADALGISKQGVLHYFPSRAALDLALARRALARVEAQLQEAAEHGSPTTTYLRLSAPSDADRAAAIVVWATVARGTDATVLRLAAEAFGRWEAMIEAELGDPVLARIVRLTGDGLFSQALVTGEAPSSEEIDSIAGWFLRDRRR